MLKYWVQALLDLELSGYCLSDLLLLLILDTNCNLITIRLCHAVVTREIHRLGRLELICWDCRLLTLLASPAILLAAGQTEFLTTRLTSFVVSTMPLSRFWHLGATADRGSGVRWWTMLLTICINSTLLKLLFVVITELATAFKLFTTETASYMFVWMRCMTVFVLLQKI